MLTEYQHQLRRRFLAEPVTPPPAPWRPVPVRAVGGLTGVGFDTDPATGDDLIVTVSHTGYGLVHAATGALLARDRNDEAAAPPVPGLTCPGIGALTGQRIRIAGLYGGGLHTVTGDGWAAEIVSPEWPYHRILLWTGTRGPYHGQAGTDWWPVANEAELRAYGFSPSGHTFVIATSSDLRTWTR